MKNVFSKRKEENVLGKLFVEHSLCNRFKNSLKNDQMFNGELNFQRVASIVIIYMIRVDLDIQNNI